MQDIYKVLVVDDDQALNQLICVYLEAEAFVAVSALSLKQAIVELENNSDIDLILLDVQLDDGSGMDLLRFDKRLSFIENVPVIMISANTDESSLEDCFALGALDYIIKPINFSLLILKVKSLIQSSKLKNLINKQNEELSKYKNDSMREEEMAKFTYEYLVQQGAEKVPGVSIWLQPSSAFSGDAVLVKTSPTGDLFMIMADATGHGLSAAITIMPIVATFNSMVAKGFHLQSIMAEINRKLVSHTPDDRFVAAIGIEINKINKELFVWNGGMPSLFVLDDEKIVHRFKSSHMALGILEDDLFDASVQELILGEENILFSCSDGLIEQVNTKNEPFSKPRLISLLQDRQKDLFTQVVNTFNSHIGNAVCTDDISMFVVDIKKYLTSSVESQKESYVEARQGSGKFSWEIQLCGDRLKTCEAIPLVQHVLQHIEINHALSQKVFIVVSEMLTNAIDHGILELSSSLKELDNGFLVYLQERERRLECIGADSYVNLALVCESNQGITEIRIRVKDSGEGYKNITSGKSGELINSGRGLQLIRSLAQSVHIEPPGNVIEAILQ